MIRPAITVIMPAYNHEAFVSQAIESVLSQTFKDFEFIIINDGSTDNTDTVIKRYNDSRIIYFNQENIGTANTINRGLELSKGDYIAIINSDDIYLENRLEILIEKAKKDDLIFLITDIGLIDEFSHMITDSSHWWIKWYEFLKFVYLSSHSPVKAFLAGNFTISTSNFFFHRSIIKHVGVFRPFRYISDYDFAFRVAVYQPDKFKFLYEQKLLLYRIHGKNTILQNPLAANYETFYFLTNIIKDVYGCDLAIPVDYLKRIQKYITKELALKHKNELIKLKHEHTEKVRELTELKHEHTEKVRELTELKHDYGRVLARLNRAKEFNSTMLDENYLLKNSVSFKAGRVLTFPIRLVRNIVRDFREKPFKIRVTDLRKLQLTIKKVLDDIDVVSFDIFDTIFERDIDPPDKVKEIVARDLLLLLRERYNIETSPFEILRLRDCIERELRQKAISQGKDFECNYIDIVKRIVESLIGTFDYKLYQEIIEKEIDVESDVLYVKNGMVDLLGWFKENKKRIIAISDMYLDKKHVAELLKRKDINCFFDNIYISSENGICKYSGRLFKHVIREEMIVPSRMLHIGDNRISDHRAPAKLGINTIYLFDKAHLKKKYVLKTYNKLAAENIYWRGRHLLQLIRPPVGTDFFYNYGYSVLGPAYCAFVYGAIDKVKQHAVDLLFFVAREGNLFLRLFKIFAPRFFNKDKIPDAKYVYLTRKSTALASAYKGLTHEMAIIPLYNPKQKGLLSILNVFGLPEKNFRHLSERHGFSKIDEPLYNWHDKRLINLIKDSEFQGKVREYAFMNRALLEKYLTQLGFFSTKKVAFIDIGWNATIQKFIQDAFVDRDDYPHVYGIYFGFCNGIGHRFDEKKNTIFGILYDERTANWSERVMNRFEEIFEEGARDLQPTVIGYKYDENSSQVQPVFKDDSSYDRQIEIQHNKKIKKIQEGVIDFASEFIRAIRLTGYTFEDIKPFISTLIERAVAFPNKEETDYLLNLTHSEDFGYDNVMDFNSDRINNLRIILDPGLFLSKIKNSNWPFGSARSSGIPGINIFLRLYDIIGRPHR